MNKRLWEQSGHWEHYAENMFKVEAEEQVFSLKPMNCPESTFVVPARASARTGTSRCGWPRWGGSTGTSARGR